MAAGRRKTGRNAAERRQAAAAAALVLAAVGVTLPALPVLAEQATLAAVAVVLPESGLNSLRQRFAPEADPVTMPEESPAQPQPAAPEPPAESSSQPERDEPLPTEEIPEEYRGSLLRETMTGQDDGGWLSLGAGWLRNYTALGQEEIAALLEETPLPDLGEGEAQVLILHTHATESYETHTGAHYDTRADWRTTDNSRNMCAIGAAMAEELEAAGIGVIHDTTQHDYPSYNGSYDRSRATAEAILARYPGLRVVLDVHRDAIQRDAATIVAPVTQIGGKSCAQVMVIAGCDDGSMNMPHWQENLRFAAALVNRMEQDWPTLTRPLFFAHRKYNQDMTPATLLLEVGSSANTMEEAEYAARLAAKSLAGLLKEGENAP